jgi:RNA polymerase sigma-70 factor, ECF subfamily
MTAIDEHIQILLSADNPQALDVIYDAYGDVLYRTLTCLICSRQDTEDCFQDLFIRIARKRHMLRGKENIRAYLLAMARNQAMEFFRGRKRDIDTVECDEAFLVAEDTAEPLPTVELSSSLAALPLEQREVIALKIFEEMTFEEIGRHLEISINTAASRYRYGIQKMKQLMLQVL